MRWETTPTGRSDRWETLAAFSVLIGLLSSALSGYRYGDGDQIVHLPEIFRAVHSSYLAHDFWLNSASQFGPRFYYTQGIALAANFIPIPVIIFFLFVSTYCATSVVVAFAARDLSGSTAAALVITSLSVWISPFWLGGAPDSRSQRSGSRLDSRVVTLPLVCLAALPPDQRMWALRFGLSHSGLRHGSVLDRTSHSLGRDFFSFNGKRRIRASPCLRSTPNPLGPEYMAVGSVWENDRVCRGRLGRVGGLLAQRV